MCIAPAKSISDDFDCRKKSIEILQNRYSIEVQGTEIYPFLMPDLFHFLALSGCANVPCL